MATTRLMPIHAGSGRTVEDVIEYVKNPEKTRNGELISSYECDSRTADAEFDLSKRQYFALTGRSQGGSDIIAYHTRQAFLPGEVTPEEANHIGHELAMSFTKGKHAFIVCTHIDKSHVHNHIIFNSTALDCKRKFRNFIGSAFALRRISDRICLENGLSVIKNPKPSRGHYGQWLVASQGDAARHATGLDAMGGDRPLTFQERLCDRIDAVLEKKPADFEAFISEMQAAGYEVKRGAYLSFRALADGLRPDQKKFTRCREKTLGVDYTENAIRERIGGTRIVQPRPHRKMQTQPPTVNQAAWLSSLAQAKRPNLLIDIQAKIQAGKGPGFERWAKVHNLKAMARTLIYLQEHGLDQRDVLGEKASAAASSFNFISGKMKELETKMSANTSLQRHIVNYSKTRQTYTDYRKAGYSKKFKAEHEADILLHQTAKKAFDELGFKKIPTVKSLREEYSVLLDEKKRARREYSEARESMKELLNAKANVDRFMGGATPVQERESESPSR